ncbi:ParB/RepB/Spo0J family partition protein [Clostridium sp. CM028]|uniref:ParB/RepB/Spo0J family partition protein n=1 Tax=unclassified Clostridium TaxID=2614128 RepID=UPI001C0C020D|nr:MULTISPECIES: ParB/RepB/Spo0J family partition protein [unclassified Clostridium]MBU3091152.1 ParB/RepB/Spo0J family partition protein [Clostridium sp. CF011]MBW9144866.1 ParB/RepB/Spo0J family partition protein [Clostridium sp. CM027]MBW9148715.1 ParB/RepB/Spo0J family partition protein [Clostridium sp. CM028]UVE40009.1 ParB/RepB/Spo0J family partition protein [Clostridium sp. CM027]WAG68932.1 ParB/RepB/Spo0J family partition protein [Clostridium sp. CF011]
MNKKFGLGKGLGALIPEEESTEDSSNVFKISMNLIKANKDQPRKNFDPEKISELAQSIKEHGVIQPIILNKEDDVYIVVAGERRFRAAKSIGLAEIPAIIMNINNKEVLEISLIENIQREDLNPIEEAIAYKKLLTEFNLTQEEISKKVSKSRTAITNCMRLLNLDERVQDYIIDGVISEGHGRAILGISDRQLQYQIAQMVIDDNLNVRETERLVKNFGNEKPQKVVKNENDIYYKDIMNRLENRFGTKVLINSKNKNKGKIEIEYYSEEDFERILEVFNI